MEAQNPEISVIVPVYKGISFLDESLGSLRRQTFRDWECVCVDDGSRDGSGALVDKIAAADPRIRVIHQANGGTSVARNTALRAVRGRYVAFLDEDDAYEPRMLETLHAAAVATNADVVGCELLRMKENDDLRFDGGPVPAASDWRVADRRGLAEWMASMYEGIPYEVWRNLYRRELVADHWFVPNVRVEQDLIWHYTLLPKIVKYVRIDWPGYAWRATAAGGFLHPDAASLVSLTGTYWMLADKIAAEMGLNAEQRQRFALKMSQELVLNVWSPLRKSVRLDAESSARLRSGLRNLYPFGVDIRRDLDLKKRLKWGVFMLTGRDWWVKV